MNELSDATYIGRRGELMAELFLQSLEPSFLSRPPNEVGLDFLVGFVNTGGGTNTFGIEVKSTDKELSTSYSLNRKTYKRLLSSNIPVCLLVADVKRNKLYYSWFDGKSPRIGGTATVQVPITEIRDSTDPALRRRFTSWKFA
jgi:hypothetical protein